MTSSSSSRPGRAAPDWDLVYHRSSLERLKRDRPPLEVRDELPDLVVRGYEDVAEEDMVRLHWWGLAHDKPKTGTFMVRIKVPGGRLIPAQLRAVGRIARIHGRDEVELTTRQGVQLHWVPLREAAAVLAAVESAGLTTFGAEGDTVRNITGCPVAGLAVDEVFDVSAVVQQVAEHLNGNPDFVNLPRKHKYSISACAAQCDAPEIADVALVGTVKDGRSGFGIRVGGGMANTPRISRDLGVFIPVDDAVEVLEAVTNAWQRDLKYRVSRAKARIKFMMDDHGPAGVRTKVEAQLGRPLESGEAPVASVQTDHMGQHQQRQPGLSYLGVPVSSGRVAGGVLEELADLVADVGGDVRLTRQQNLIVGNVAAEHAEEVVAGLAGLGLPVDRGRAVARSVACTDHRFCSYSVAGTKDKLEEILSGVSSRFGADAIGDLSMHVDGCPHACAQHWIGEIGLQGTTTRVDGCAERVQAYDVTVGGGLGARTAIGRRLLRRVPTGEVNGVVERLVGGWLAARAERDEPGFTLGDFCSISSDEQLIALATEQVPPDRSGAAGIVVNIPGPLLDLVDGQDRLEVSAKTVGEALAAIAIDHPDFGTTVLPNGRLAPAFLVAVGDDDIRTLDELTTAVAVGTEVTIVMALAGG